MNRFMSVFSQILQHLFSRLEFEKAVKGTKAERHARGFSSWSQFVAMLFYQLGRAKSLREICGGLACCEGKLSHLGITPPPRSTPAYANANRPWTLYKTVLFQLLGRCQAVAQAVAAAPARNLILDGEVVVFAEHLVSRFELLRHRDGPLVYAVFDCLRRNGKDLRWEPLRNRREVLEAVAAVDRLFPARRLAKNGLAAFRTVQRKGYEGLVAKEEAAPYVPGRSERWVKVKVRQQGEFVIGGYTEGGAGVSSVLVGVQRSEGLRYVGEVEFGFSPANRVALCRQFQRLALPRSPFANLPRKRGTAWLAPRLVAAITFQEWMGCYLRHPFFRGLAEGKILA